MAQRLSISELIREVVFDLEAANKKASLLWQPTTKEDAMTATEKCRTIIEERRMKNEQEERKTEFMQRKFERLRTRVDDANDPLTEERALAQIEAEWEIEARNERDRCERYAKWKRDK